MNFAVSIAIAICIIQPFYTQAELSIVAHDIEIPRYNREYFSNIDIYLLDNGNDNECYVNFTVIKVIPTTATTHLIILGASMGEFVVPTGIDFKYPMCRASNKDPIFGRHIFDSLGMVYGCPAPTGVYGAEKVNLLQMEKLPVTFPPNKYKMSIEFKDEKTFYCQIDTYFDIQ